MAQGAPNGRLPIAMARCGAGKSRSAFSSYLLWKPPEGRGSDCFGPPARPAPVRLPTGSCVPAMSHHAGTRWNQIARRKQDERRIYHLAPADTYW